MLFMVPFGTVRIMQHHIHDVITRIEKYANAAGIQPETVVRRATNNPRLFERLKRKADSIDADIAKIEAHMRDNPVGGVGGCDHASQPVRVNQPSQALLPKRAGA